MTRDGFKTDHVGADPRVRPRADTWVGPHARGFETVSRKRVWRRLWLWTPAAVYMGIIFYLSSQSDPLPALTTHVWDKLLHTTEYAGLAFLFARAFHGDGVDWWAAATLAVLATSLYGASDEVHQAFVPLRSSDVHDWIADTLGGTLGVLAYTAIRFNMTRLER